jgi:hypothetical protein
MTSLLNAPFPDSLTSEDTVASTVQELLGLSKALDQLEQRISTYRAYLLQMALENHPAGDIEQIAITTGEVDTVEALVLGLARRISGAEPEPAVWEPMNPYCSRNAEKGQRNWASSNYEHFRWALLWIQKTRTYLEYLGGLQAAAGDPRDAARPPSEVASAEGMPRYDVALSFAGEDRGHARQIADRLRAAGFSVFYDEYEQATLWGRNLYTHLSDVYQNRARFCLMFISASYARKLWTKREREAAQARAFRESREYILPLRLDDTALPGVEDTVGYIDLRNVTCDEVVRLLAAKLRAPGVEGRGSTGGADGGS